MRKTLRTGMASIILATSLIMPTGLALADSVADESGIQPTITQDVSTFKNNKDTGYNFKFSSKGATQGTTGRAKQDDSSVYVKVNSRSGNPIRMYVDGALTNNGHWVDCTQGSHYANRTGEFNIYNSVFESNKRYARLTGWAYKGSGTVMGVWSPDSYGTYPQL